MDINKLIEQLEPVIRGAFLAAVADVRSEAQLALLVGAIERGDIDGAIRVLNIRPEMFAPLDDALRAAYLEGGRQALAGLPAIPDPLPEGVWLRGLTAATRAPRHG